VGQLGAGHAAANAQRSEICLVAEPLGEPTGIAGQPARSAYEPTRIIDDRLEVEIQDRLLGLSSARLRASRQPTPYAIAFGL
jgi:hypothetical protein